MEEGHTAGEWRPPKRTVAVVAGPEDLPDDDWMPPGKERAAVGDGDAATGGADGGEDYDDDGLDEDDNDAHDYDDFGPDDRTASSGSGAYQPKKHILASMEAKINLDMMGRDRPVPGHVAGALRKHDLREEDRREKTKDKSDRATNEQVLDDRTRLVIFKFIRGNYFTQINGCISTGKEANVYYCENTWLPPDPCSKSNFPQLALKIFKTSILVFKDRDRYVTGEFRFRRGYAKSNPRKMVKIWAEKEFRNLVRLRKGGVRAPEPILVRSHLLLMEFLGIEGWPSPRLKDANLSAARLSKCYRMLLLDMRTMYHQCRLVHADLSEYNILYHQKQLFIIDVSQSVEHDHPHAMEFLRSDCTNVTRFFSNNGTVTLRMQELFEFVTALDFGEVDAATHLDRLLEVASTRPPMTEAELMEQHVFERVYIPRTLGEVDPEKEHLKSEDAKEYLGATSVIAGIEGSADPVEKSGDQDDGHDDGDTDDEEDDDENSDEHIEGKSVQRKGFAPADPNTAARTAALFCISQLPLPEAARILIGKLVWSTREDPEWMRLVRRLHKPSRKDLKSDRKDNKAKVKMEKREARKKKIPKHAKKRAIKQSTTKKRK